MHRPKIILNTVFSRVMLFNIILVIIATIVPQIAFLRFYKPSYETEINNNNMQMVTQIQKTIDGQLEKVVTIPVTYLAELNSNTELTNALITDITKDPSKIWGIQNRLNDIKSTLTFIDSFDIYYTNGNVFFVDNGVQFLDDISSSKMHDLEWVDWLKNADFNFTWIPTRHIERYQPRNIFSFIRRIPFNASKEDTKAIAIVNVNEDVLRNYIKDVNLSNNSMILIADKNGDIISHSNQNMVAKNVKEIEYFKTILKSGPSGMFKTKIDGRMNVISFVRSTVNDWTYISISSIQEFYEKSYKLESFMLIMSIIMLALNLLAAVFFTKKMHEPINNIIRAIKSMTTKLSGNDSYNVDNEYKYMNTMVKNIEFQIDDLNDRLEKNKPLIKQNILMNLLIGNSSVTNNDRLFNLKFDQEKIMCFILKIYQHSELSFDDRLLINYNLVDLLNGEYSNYNVHVLIDNNSDIVGIINYGEDITLQEIEEGILQKIEALLNAKYILCEGNSYSINDNNISTSYQEASVCLNYSFIKTDNKILHYNKLGVNSLGESNNTQKLLERLEDFVRSSDEANIKLTINSIIEAITYGYYKIEFCINTLMDVVSLVRITLSKMGYNPDELFGGDIRDYFKTLQDIDEFKFWINEVISIYISKSNEKKQGLNDDLIARVKRFIEDHIYSEISLDTVAEDMHMSTGYLSRIFKERSGETFSNYVTGVKLQHSVKLLQKGNMTVKDISSKLGYNSAHHFIKIFKEKYGSTPKEYQKLTSKEE